MRAAAALLLALGATARAGERPAFLDLDAPWPTTELAVTARPTAVSLAPGGAAAGEIPAGEKVAVLEATPEHVRVLGESRVARVALYVAPAALPLVARSGAILTGDAGRPGDARVELPAGATLEPRGAAEGDLQPVTWRRGRVVVRGLIDAAHLGRSYVPEARALPLVDPDATLRLPAQLLDGPGGAALIALPGRGALPVDRLGDEQRGHVKVRAELGDARVEGWVAKRALGPDPGVIGRTASAPRIGIPGRRLHTPPAMGGVRLERGTLLSAVPGGPPVAVILEAATFARRGDAVEITGPWGPLLLHAAR